MVTDGLDIMEQTRQTKTARRPRIVPPPIHHKAPLSAGAGEHREAGGAAPTELDEVVDIRETPKPPPEPALISQQGIQGAAKAAPRGGELEKLQFYVDDHVRGYLRDVQRVVFDRNDRKLDVSNSAVVRLAFRVLAQQMTPTQVIDHLAEAPQSDTPGRKRR